jgi:hypothetical protein
MPQLAVGQIFTIIPLKTVRSKLEDAGGAMEPLVCNLCLAYFSDHVPGTTLNG